jgi:pimeloyl-ACP methyl ester carboxylesterase
MTHRLVTVTVMLGCVLSASRAHAAPASSCESLAKLSLPETTITSAQENTTGEFNAGSGFGGGRLASLPAFCRVALTVQPQIRIEVWLPKDNWNGSYRGEGGGGYAGNISYGGLAEGLRNGYATASTDTGHPTSAGGTFALNADGSPNTQLIGDFAERSLRELATKAKAIINAYYGTPARHSYWNGCSTGGRQGLMAAQRFPEEYDGLAIAAPAINWDRFIPSELWPQIVMNKTVGGPIPPAKLALATKAAVAACDASDGVADGVLNDPRKCTYDPHALVCKPDGGSRDAASCLTGPEADAIAKIWNGPTNASGRRLWFGLERGTPLNFLAGGTPFPIATAHAQYWVHQDPKFDWHTLSEADFEAELRESQKKLHDVIGTDEAKLDKFLKRGGKMIIWHGDADQLIFPRGTINYFERVRAANGGAKRVDDSIRLFLAPGVGHCGGGDGPAPVGVFEDVVNWVEKGAAPKTVQASRKKPDGTTVTRPLCPYPTTAKWTGKGSADEAANFMCVGGKQQAADFKVVER